MTITCHTCGRVDELPEGFWQGGAHRFWDHVHGHRPERTTLMCECGETIEFGPDVGPPGRDMIDTYIKAQEQARSAIRWYQQHLLHQMEKAPNTNR